MKIKGLPPKQALFVREYLKDLNGKQAAIRAGFAPRSAEVTASQLLSKPKVREIIEELNDKRCEKIEVNAAMILKELIRIATSDISAAFDDQGNIKPLRDIPEDIRRAISGAQKLKGKMKIDFWDKLKALELLGKHMKLFTDKIEHSGTLSLEEIVAGSQEAKE